MSNLSSPYLHDEEAAYAFLEGVLWPQGPVCPHCGGMGRISKIKANPEKRVRHGLHRCGDCKKQFTVKVGTVFEASNVKLHLWLQAVVLMTASKKGVSAHQLHRVLGVTYKTAWFMGHRIREAMREGDLAPFGANGGFVEVDETFIGNDRDLKPKRSKRIRGGHHKFKVLALVDRESGKARTMVVDDFKAKTLAPILSANIAREATLMTDEARYYIPLGKDYAAHKQVHHRMGEYVSRRNPEVHTNTVEGYFSVFKRGMKGVYQHCAKRHLHRYVAEFEFRYNHRSALGIEDRERVKAALTNAMGKRLRYVGPDSRTKIS